MIIIICLIASIIFILTGAIGYILEDPRKNVMTVKVSAPIQQVWDTITDPKNQVNWRSDLERVEMEDVNKKVWTEYLTSGPNITFKEEEKIKHEKYRIKIIPRSGFSGYSTIRFKDKNSSTIIRFKEVSKVPNPYRRILSYIFYDPEQRMKTYIKDLKGVFKPF